MTTNYERRFGSTELAAEALAEANICWGTMTGEIGAAVITALVLFLIATALVKLIVVVVSL